MRGPGGPREGQGQGHKRGSLCVHFLAEVLTMADSSLKVKISTVAGAAGSLADRKSWIFEIEDHRNRKFSEPESVENH